MSLPVQRRVPNATYRLQFNGEFTFEHAAQLLDYLCELGITDCYASPIFQAAPNSSHGYNVCAFDRFSSEAGGEAGFQAFAHRLRDLHMGLLLDMVPNHMSNHPANPWWQDTLENGPLSPCGDWFDIDWQSPGDDLRGKVLLPILEDHYWRVLEAGKLRLLCDRGNFFVAYYDSRFPLSPASYAIILTRLLAVCRENNATAQTADSLEMLVETASHLELFNHTQRAELKRIQAQFARWLNRSEDLRRHLSIVLGFFNGKPGEPRSFDELDAILRAQHYRLAWWRVGSEEINYRRFFDITELASLRIELPAVFQAAHRLVFKLMSEGSVTGLRIDHPDGLWDPKQYLERLQSEWRRLAPDSSEPLFVVVEKILSGNELLPLDWPVDGTTGYDFLNQVNGLFVKPSSRPGLDRIYSDFAGAGLQFADLVYRSKQRLLKTDLASELLALTRRLKRLAALARRGQDFSFSQLQGALQEILACFPVYRTYVSEESTALSESEQAALRIALSEARRRGPLRDHRLADQTVFDFLEQFLSLHLPEDLENASRQEARKFVQRFQQLSSPVMAKGLEDTAFYNFCRLLSLNEVGGNPDTIGVTPEQFHAAVLSRAARWPHSLLATATHDTKRGEDARMRINVLSEMPEPWRAALARWARFNATAKTPVQGHPSPDSNDEYAFYQTLVGAWTPEASTREGLKELRQRIETWMLKSVRESKAHTSWTWPDKPYEEAVSQFVQQVLSDAKPNPFLEDFIEFEKTPAFFGAINSLSLVLLKTTAPGVPDFYQGTELWDFNLVDPDNRRPVDYELRRRLLSALKAPAAKPAALLERLMAESETGQIKLYLTWRLLACRNASRELFKLGTYHPLTAAGKHRDHLCAFARATPQKTMISLTPRLCLDLLRGERRWPLGSAVWEDTSLPLEGVHHKGRFRNVLTDETLSLETSSVSLPVAQALSHFPVALLESL